MKKKIKQVLSLILCVSMVLTSFAILASCNEKKDVDPKEDLTFIVENGETKYKIVRPDKANENVISLAVSLRRSINDKFGCDIDLESDWAKPGEEIDSTAFEILVGDTNRAESQEVKDSLDDNSWTIQIKGNKLVICASNDTMLNIAIDWFVQTYIENADKQLGIPKDLSKTEGVGDAIPLSVNGITSYQIVYPKGNENLEYYGSLIQKHTKLNEKTIAVVDNESVKSEYCINITVDSGLAANEYKVWVDGNNINISAVNEDTLYYAVNYFLEYGVTLSDTMVTLSKDYSLSGKLDNYFSDKWEMPIPALSHSAIAPAYDIGTGLANDKNADTIIDSYLHLVSNFNIDKYTEYTKRLESFGFKNIYSATTDQNTLTCYRLGKAYVYLHYCPKQNAMRVIWDKSSNCEISDVAYTAEGNGTTTFYQYSIDYTNAELNFTGKGINCGMLYIIKLADNSLILVDSGHNSQSCDESLKGLYDFLYEITGTDKKESLNIRFWYYTHPDGDHNELTSKLYNYIKNHGLKIPNVEALGFAYPSERANDNLGKTDGSYEMIELMRSTYPNINYLKLHTGMVFNIGEVKFEVISTVENIVEASGKIPNNFNTNDVCSVVRFSFDGMSVLMQGDQGPNAQKYLIGLYNDEFIQSDAIQIAHHGFNETFDMFTLSKAKYALVSNSRANITDSVRKNILARTGMPESNVLYAGDYTYGLKMTNGKIEVIQIMRYDNPNKK